MLCNILRIRTPQPV